APVAGGAETAQLARNRAARLFLPRPDALEEGLAPHAPAVCLVLLLQQTLDHHLRGDAGMIGARLPQHIAPAHPLEAAENILNGVVEGMPHMERARHIGWRDYDRERLGLGSPPRLEICAPF